MLYTLEEVAERFRVSRRTLQDFLRAYPYYRKLGRRKLFTEADIVRLYEALPCPSSSSRRARANRPIGRSAAPTSAGTLTEALRLASGHSRSRCSGGLSAPSNVVSLPSRMKRRSRRPRSTT